MSARALVALTMAVGLLAMVVIPVAAATPQDYLDDMPAVPAVETAFTGATPLETYALRLDAFIRLENIVKDIIAARGAAAPATQAESVLMTAYDLAQDRAIAAAKATMPADEQGFYIGTQFTAWAQVADGYQADPAFNTRFRAVFAATFLSTYASTLTKEEAADAVPLVLPTATRPAPAGNPRGPLAPNADPPDPGQYLPILAWLGAYFALYVVVGILRPKKSANEVNPS
jgi:hypothetical protein